MLEMKSYALEKIHTDDNGSDMMTKSLPVVKFNSCKEKTDLVEQPIST